MSRAVFGLPERQEVPSMKENGAGTKRMSRIEFESPVEASADTHTIGFPSRHHEYRVVAVLLSSVSPSPNSA